MTIKQKLQALIWVVACALIVVVGMNYYSTMNIKASVMTMTSQSTPAQVKTLELQQNVEKISAEFMRMSVAGEEHEVQEAFTSIENSLKKVGSLAHELEAIGVTGAAPDMNEFSSLNDRVRKAVSQKIADTASLRTEAANMAADLKELETVIAEVAKEASMVNSRANANLTDARSLGGRNNASIKKALTLHTLLKDLELGINEMEGVKNKFKLTPFSERFKSIADSVAGMTMESGDPALISEIKTGVAAAYKQISSETGLIALKKKLLADPAVESQYADHRKSILQNIGSLSTMTFEVIDRLEGELARSGKTMNDAAVFQEGAGNIARLVAEINLGGKQLGEYSKLVILASGEKEVQSYLSLAQRDSSQIQQHIQAVRNILPSIKQDALARKIDEMTSAIRSSQAATERIAAEIGRAHV